MEGGEVQNFIKVWLSVSLALCYCYAIRNSVPKGIKRLFFVLPVVGLFLYLPLKLSSVHLGGVTSFFLCWLANFKLLLFAFGKGPLASDPNISLPFFVAICCLPIKIQEKNPPPKFKKKDSSVYAIPNGCKLEAIPNTYMNGQNKENPPQKYPKKENPCPKNPREGLLNYTIKGLVVAILVKVYDYSDQIHPNVVLLLYAFHMYFLLEIILAVGAAMARTILGIELEPQFNKPYLSTSLQDFWSRRWNLMVTRILYPTVYEPTVHVCSRIIPRKWAPLPAVFGTFVVSALMHELIFYYLVRRWTTWNMTWFFLLHGACVTAEIVVKKVLSDRLQLPRLISGMLTVGFVVGTGLWLFLPIFVEGKIDVRAFEEYAAVGAFMQNVSQSMTRVLPRK